MSQQRQEARRAQQERQREARRAARVAARRAVIPASEQPRRVAVPAVGARRGRLVRLATIGLGGALVLALAAFLIYDKTRPLPGEAVESNGSQHVQPSEPHGAYSSNPPTSGWMYDPMMNPGVYTRPKAPEELVHFLEHGGVWVLYTCPEGCPELAQQLTQVVNKETDRNSPAAVAPYPPPDSPERTYDRPARKINVVAWQRLLSLDEFDGPKIEEFTERTRCRGLESGPGCPRAGRSAASQPAQKDAGESGFNALSMTTSAPAFGQAATPTVPATPVAAAPTPAIVGPPTPVAVTGTPAP